MIKYRPKVCLCAKAWLAELRRVHTFYQKFDVQITIKATKQKKQLDLQDFVFSITNW